jgi:hypothetical protein
MLFDFKLNGFIMPENEIGVLAVSKGIPFDEEADFIGDNSRGDICGNWLRGAASTARTTASPVSHPADGPGGHQDARKIGRQRRSHP